MQVVDRVEVHVLHVERKHAPPHARVQHRGGDAGQIRFQELQDCVLHVPVAVSHEWKRARAREGDSAEKLVNIFWRQDGS